MKKYYCVSTICKDDGKVYSRLVAEECLPEKPENTFKELTSCDLYMDWFESLEDANDFIEQAKFA